MNLSLLSLFALLAPLSFVLISIWSKFQQNSSVAPIKKGIMAAAFFNILLSLFFAILVMQYGLLESSKFEILGLGISLRLDALSIIMFVMIALLAFIVVKFSCNYLDGDERQGIFMGRLAAAIASVQLLVISGNLAILFIAWVGTSLALHRLLVFYPNRPRAIIAARKKFIVARAGDISLLAGFIVLYSAFGTGNLEIIFQRIIEEGLSNYHIEAAAMFIVLAAILKSAQFPTHGWLIEVMETPTPVSALLHAGLLNAGPFLIARMAFVMDGASYAPVILVAVGGFTALFASLVFITQASIKTSLGYSSVAHMGFSLMMCGLGVYAAAMLHLVAHSFYKAHSFLSSGSVIDLVRTSKIALPKRLGSPFRIIVSFLLALTIFIAIAFLWGIDPLAKFGMFAIGSIIVMGLTTIIAPALDSDGPFKGIVKTLILAASVAFSFFFLEAGAHFLLHSQIPALKPPTFILLVLMGLILLSYSAVIIIQIISPTAASNTFWWKMGVHLRNGCYVNSLFDRLVRSLYHIPAKDTISGFKDTPQTSSK
ncbi:proton-conducting transporter transmembrane domain-containing protein [Brumimicrobium oceani]|uniref:Probable inorganic carbon transporter subunit DabB n=1 Tax=Brumimicrobium oceani TaxID=2100725 RepID=A0A2U2XD17_9FLAO|nr:proton-conducting transporter membrane subunit [Brumimicrobium oceani]PWH85682.1 NADH/ubiquinone/plastoquinone (complex i) [Brumimicrobium oceani]